MKKGQKVLKNSTVPFAATAAATGGGGLTKNGIVLNGMARGSKIMSSFDSLTNFV